MVEKKGTYMWKRIMRETERERGMMKREKWIEKKKIGSWNPGHHSSRQVS